MSCGGIRSKALATAALGTLHAVLHCTFGSIFDAPSMPQTLGSHLSPEAESRRVLAISSASAAAAVEWRAFYPGIFGGLHAISRAGYKR